MLILACGSRTYTDRDTVRRALLNYWPDPDGHRYEIMHGGARGADTLADEEARRFTSHVTVFPADWERYGRAAGPIRTQHMLDKQPDVVLAFGRGRGTDFAVREAERRGLHVVRHP